MSDRIDPANDDLERRPWPQVSDLSRLFDRGRPWCVNAAAHPDENHDYPDPERHLPWHECRSAETFVDGVCRDLAGESVAVSGLQRGAVPVRRAPRGHRTGGRARGSRDVDG